jgi:hypothetical protein
LLNTSSSRIIGIATTETFVLSGNTGNFVHGGRTAGLKQIRETQINDVRPIKVLIRKPFGQSEDFARPVGQGPSVTRNRKGMFSVSTTLNRRTRRQCGRTLKKNAGPSVQT